MKEDSSGSVRAIAAQALGQYGTDADAAEALDVLIERGSVEKNSVFVAMLAVTALDEMGGRASSAKERIAALPQKPKYCAAEDGGLYRQAPGKDSSGYVSLV